MRFTAKIINGDIIFHDKNGLKKHLSQIEGNECYIDIKPSKQRNTAQNNYYWQILKEFGRQCGYHAEEMHDVCKVKFKIKSITLSHLKCIIKSLHIIKSTSDFIGSCVTSFISKAVLSF